MINRFFPTWYVLFSWAITKVVFTVLLGFQENFLLYTSSALVECVTRVLLLNLSFKMCMNCCGTGYFLWLYFCNLNADIMKIVFLANRHYDHVLCYIIGLELFNNIPELMRFIKSSLTNLVVRRSMRWMKRSYSYSVTLSNLIV